MYRNIQPAHEYLNKHFDFYLQMTSCSINDTVYTYKVRATSSNTFTLDEEITVSTFEFQNCFLYAQRKRDEAFIRLFETTDYKGWRVKVDKYRELWQVHSSQIQSNIHAHYALEKAGLLLQAEFQFAGFDFDFDLEDFNSYLEDNTCNLWCKEGDAVVWKEYTLKKNDLILTLGWYDEEIKESDFLQKLVRQLTVRDLSEALYSRWTKPIC